MINIAEIFLKQKSTESKTSNTSMLTASTNIVETLKAD